MKHALLRRDDDDSVVVDDDHRVNDAVVLGICVGSRTFDHRMPASGEYYACIA